jgi:hypothetical protein
MATSTGTFGIPNAWIYNSGAYNNTSMTLDQKKARDYLRGQLPDYTFSDPELDILVAGNYLPNAPETYLTNYTAPSAKVVADGGSTDVNTGSTVVVDEKVSSGALPTDFQLDPVVSGDAPPPPPPIDDSPLPPSSGTGDSAEVSDSVLGGDAQAQAGPYFDPQGGGRFYGTGGSFIDPITGQMQFNNFAAPVYDANAVFQQRDFGSYNEIFPVTMYGMAPAQTLAELDRIGLGLDYVRNNLNQEDLQKWWNQVFTPLYQNILGRTQTTTEVSSGGTASPFLSGYNTGNLLFGQTDPGQMGQGFDLSQSLNFGLDPTSFLGQVYGGINQIGDVTVSPDQFSIDQAATEKALTDQLGQILLNPDQFGIDPGTAEALRNQLNISVGADQFNLDPYTSRNLLSQLGLIDVGADQFNVNSNQIRSALTDRLGQILIDPSQFALGSQVVQGDTPGSYQVITPQDKLLQDLGLIDVGAGQFSLDSNAVQDYLLNQLGDISLDPSQFSIDSNAADILRNQLVSGIAPILASDIRVDPLSIAQDIRGDITSGISPITIQDLQYDPLSIAQDIRGDITSGISPIGRDDIGLGDEQIADLLDPLLSRIGALPEQFQSGAGAELGSIISGLENRLSNIEGFSAGDQFLRPETTAAQNLYDILYGTTGGSGPSGGISGFQAPESIQQLSDQIGTFGNNPTGIAAQIQDLQRGLGQLDFSQLQDLPDLSALVGDLGLLNERTPEGIDSLTQLTSTLGQFTQEDQNLISLLINFLGEDVVNNLNPDQLQTLVNDLKGAGTQVDALKDSLSGLRPVEEGAFGPGRERDLIRGLTSDISALQDDVTGLDFNRLGELSTQIGDRETDIGDLESLISGVDFSALGEESDLLNRIDAVRGLIAGDDDSLQADISNLDLSRITGDLDREIGSARTSLGSFQNFINDISYENIKEPENLQALTTSVDNLNTALGKVDFTKVVDAPELTGLIGDVQSLNEELGAINFDLADPSTKDIDIDSIFTKVSSIRDNLENIDLDSLIAPEGLSDLDATISSLSDNLPGVDTNLSSLRNELGSFTEDDMSRMDSILSLFGPDGIRSLNPEELKELSDTFGDSQRDLFTEFLGRESSFDTGLDDIGRILQLLQDPDGLFTVNVNAPDIGFGIEDIERAIRDNVPGTGDTDVNGTRGTGSTGTGAGTGTGSTSPSNFLTTLENALTGKIENQPDITSDYLRSDPITASLLADLQESQRQQGQSLQEQLQRFGVISSGDALQALPELASAQRREELDVLSDAAQRITGERQEALNQGLDLGRTLTTREQALGTLLGTVDGQQTLDSRQMDLDILAAAIAALDPNLDPGTKDPAQKGIAMALLKLLGMEDDPFLADLVSALGLRE